MIRTKIYTTNKREEEIMKTIATKKRGKNIMKKKLQHRWKKRRKRKK